MSDSSRDAGAPATISGARVVLAIIGALVIVTAVVLMGFALFEPEAAPCASGELAENVLRADGTYEPRTETFETVEEAEAFICHGVPELSAEGWTLEAISAERTVPIGLLVENIGVGIVSLGYVQDGTGRSLTIDTAPLSGPSYFESQLPEQRTEEPLEVGEEPGTAYRFGINPDAVTVIWTEDDLEHRANAQLTPDFALADLAELLEMLE